MKGRNNILSILFLIVSLTLLISNCDDDYYYTFSPHEGPLLKNVDYYIQVEITCDNTADPAEVNITIRDDGNAVSDAEVRVNGHDIWYEPAEEMFIDNIPALAADEEVIFEIDIDNNHLSNSLRVPVYPSFSIPHDDGLSFDASSEIFFEWTLNPSTPEPQFLNLYIADEFTPLGDPEYDIPLNLTDTSHLLPGGTLIGDTTGINVILTSSNGLWLDSHEYESDSSFYVFTEASRTINTNP